MKTLITTLGPVAGDELGIILPHEHVFVDLGVLDAPQNHLAAKAGPVIDLMAPELAKLKALGATALVECTPLGVGRRADLVHAVSEATDLPILVPTGIYREPWVPRWAHKASVGEIRDWMLGELTGQIEESGVQAGWIKLSAGDDDIRVDRADRRERRAGGLDQAQRGRRRHNTDRDQDSARRGTGGERDGCGHRQSHDPG
jgi:phosphotriesterase-related protein